MRFFEGKDMSDVKPMDYLIKQGEKELLIEYSGKKDGKAGDRMADVYEIVYETLRGEA